MLKDFIRIFKAKLAVKLAEKTSWGRNDLMLVIEQTLTETLADMLS